MVAPPSMRLAASDGDAIVRSVPIFGGIADSTLSAALAAGCITVRVISRDDVLDDPRTMAPSGTATIVVHGQVAVAVFSAAELASRLAEQHRRATLSASERKDQSLLGQSPLARVAQKNLALFINGDVFNSSNGLGGDAASPTRIAFYAAAPTTIVEIDGATIADFAAQHPEFETRFRRALTIGRERMVDVTGVKQEILDFYVRQGMSVAGERVRVRQVGLCIDCKLCEEACEERYGARRLTLSGYQLGMLDFIYTCRTCTDQRCIDPCAYDSISFDAATNEVVINETTCTGCTACAQACPYGAIDMVDIEDPRSPTFSENFKLRLEANGALTFGAGTPRVAKPRRIANKCDHCAAYGDQACVSACPTGSLIEMNVYALFRERAEAVVQAARDGFAADLTSAPPELLPTKDFIQGPSIRDGGLANIRRRRIAPFAFWFIGIVGLLLGVAEILLRRYAPTMSWQYHHLKGSTAFVGLPDAVLQEKIGYRAGDTISVYAGLIGTILMIVAAIYPIFRRVRVFRWLAANTMWFDFHVMAGIVGPSYIALHSALRLGTWVSIAFWSMVIVVLSGFIGRYLYTYVPSLSGGMELEELEHEGAFAQARANNATAMDEIDLELVMQRERVAAVTGDVGVLRVLVWLVAQDVRRPQQWLARRRRFAALGLPPNVRDDLLRRASRMMLIARSRVVAPNAQLLLHAWKKVHVPFTVLLTIVATAHIWMSWSVAW